MLLGKLDRIGNYSGHLERRMGLLEARTHLTVRMTPSLIYVDQFRVTIERLIQKRGDLVQVSV